MKTLEGTSSKEVGSWGESHIETLLKNKGFDIFKKNWRTPFGEVDLVANKNGQLVIFEIKTRLSEKEIFDPRQVLGFSQRARLSRAALWIWQKERMRFESISCRLAIVMRSGVKLYNLPLLYDTT